MARRCQSSLVASRLSRSQLGNGTPCTFLQTSSPHSVFPGSKKEPQNQKQTSMHPMDPCCVCFSRKTFRRRVLQKIVGVSHTTHIPHISITPHISHTYPFQTYPINTYPTNTYPFNTYPTNTYPCDAYPFNAYPCKRFASAGMAMYVNAKHILACHCISRNGNVCECKTYPCISLISRNGNEYEYHCMSFHTIATRREW